jgi:Tol biopolymer transport system component/DNA-binding winged helix-turn-helix (wHTH) protein
VLNFHSPWKCPMSQQLPRGRVIRFGLFEVNLETGELRKEGVLTRLQDRPLEILTILLEDPGRVVTREEFRQQLWPADTFVDFDHSLNVSINKLRQALGDAADNSCFVATVGRRGYRFIAPVQEHHPTQTVLAPAGTGADSNVVQDKPAAGRRGMMKIRLAAGLALALLITTLVGFSGFRSLPQVKDAVQLTHKGDVFRNQLLTDGPRIYFREGVENQGTLQQMPVEGGESSSIPDIRSDLILGDLFSRSSALLLVDREKSQDSLWVVSLAGNSVRRIGKIKADSATWSPDGKRVAYTSGPDVYVANSDGNAVLKIATLPQIASCVRWSPDGARLRFVVDDPRPLQSSLWEAGSDGRGLRPVVPGWMDSPREGCGNWTADGRFFFFESAHENNPDIWAIREKASWFGWKNPQPVRLTSGPLSFFSPTPSRDGNQLFVVGEQRRGELTRYDEDSKQFEPFLGGISAVDVQFSHDGKWISYVTFPERTLWRSRADGSERLQLTTPPTRAFLPQWSPDDQRILFHAFSKPNQPWKIYLVSPAGGTPELLVSDQDSQEAGGTWAPSGNKVVYAYNKVSTSPSSASLEIRVLDLKTKFITTLSGSQGLYAPQWSPDGRYVAALAQRDYLMLFDTAAQEWKRLLTLGVGYPTWSPDGQYLYCNTLWRPNPALIRLAVKSGKTEAFPVNFSATGSYGAWSGLTPDGSFLLLRDRGSRDIYSLDLELP